MWIPQLDPNSPLPIISVGRLTTTPYCWAGCAFCRLAQPLPKVQFADAPAGLSFEHVLKSGVDLTLVTQIRLRGGLSLHEPFDYWIHFLRRLRAQFTGQLVAFSPVEVWHYHLLERRSVRELLTLLQWAGADLLGPGGSESWSRELRARWTRHRIKPEEWFEVAESAHAVGLKFSMAPIVGAHLDDTGWREYLAVVRHYTPQQLEIKPLRSADTRWSAHDSAGILETAEAIHRLREALGSISLHVSWDEEPLEDAAEIFAAAGADALEICGWEVTPG